MINSYPRFIEMRSRGVHTSETHLALSSVTESDLEIAQKPARTLNSRDADHSNISVSIDSKVPSNSVKSASDTDVELYRMKTVSRKGLKDHPSRIEFQRMNRSVENRYKKDHKRHPPQRLHKCHCMLGPESAFSALNIPSQTAQKNNSLEPLGSCHSSQVFQPRSVRSKVHKMFSGWFQRRRSTPAKYNQEQPHDDAESGCSDGENVETYHFDHGSTSYYRTTDCPPHLISEIIAQRTTFHATKFWAEFFGSINIIVTFIITFFLQFYRFILYSILRAIIVGFLQITSDYLLKPILAVIFNGFLQPQLIFTQNVFQSICNMFAPLTTLTANILKPFAECVRAFRIVEVRNINKEMREQQQQASVRFQAFQGQNNV